MIRILAIVAIVTGVFAQQPGAKLKFYDASGIRSNAADPPAQPTRLRPIRFVHPFPPRGNVGIHYWFEDAQGVPFRESRAANAGGRFTLHVRNNVGGGFLTVWSIDGQGGLELTPRIGQHAGVSLSEREYVIPGEFQFRADGVTTSVILVFARSQTEQASNPAHARERLRAISGWMGRNGPQVISESDDTTAGQVGTYVVNQDGGPVATEIILR